MKKYPEDENQMAFIKNRNTNCQIRITSNQPMPQNQ